MASKQEKLAAARRKLKEFQGKSKETELAKQRSISDTSVPKIFNNSTISGTSHVNDKENFKLGPQSTQPYFIKQPFYEEKMGGNAQERRTSESSVNGSNSLRPNYNTNENSVDGTSFFTRDKPDSINGLRVDLTESHNADDKRNFKTLLSSGVQRDDGDILSEKDYGANDNLPLNDTLKAKPSEVKQFFSNDSSNEIHLKEVVESLQSELQNHMQTAAILIQQRNDAQTSLSKTQGLLNERTGEVAELKQQVMHLSSCMKNMSQRLSDAEDVIMKLKLEKEDNLQKQEEIMALSEEFQTKLAEREEGLQEMKRKYEEKSSECQKLLFSLQESQSQISLLQIQLQQYSAEGHSTLATQVSELQNENLSLKQKITELKEKLESVSAEKEESSQKFHVYAQQCNSQLSLLTSQLNSLKLEYDNLTLKNNVLSENLSELENSKEKVFSSESFESEIANLHNQLSALSEKNEELNNNLKEKEEKCSELENNLKEKDLELNEVIEKLHELEIDNKKLANEAEMPKANERLLATMESDKIAAAKAVSQNRKLKEQVVELEEAFMRLSEEKLELTNQLAHEKHVNTELQNLMKNSESKHQGDHHGEECHHEVETQQPLVNDSNEIEELRKIIRQLQDDKVELTARLNSYESSKGSPDEKQTHEKTREHEHNHGEMECEDTKLLLQQMEEKVRKTMNEIAVLDEEKEKLEHLVLQLQGETETIGEYITLYQKQRMLLRQRAQEKDTQLLQLSKEKEELKSKLVALDELVQRLIAERENGSIQSASKLSAANPSKVPENTAGQIRALINEIGSTTLISNQTIVFEHCSCCSGRLITI